MRRIRWGVLGVAKIATDRVIPAMQRGQWSEVSAIASRDLDKARAAAAKLGIAKAYRSYEALLEDGDIDAIYNPLPNHLHVPWTIKSAERAKLVLCEKPIALSADEARQLVAARDRTGVQIQEAFMVRTHPQWLTVKELVTSCRIGEVRSMLGARPGKDGRRRSTGHRQAERNGEKNRLPGFYIHDAASRHYQLRDFAANHAPLPHPEASPHPRARRS
jgi:predicted dehydrogenase